MPEETSLLLGRLARRYGLRGVHLGALGGRGAPAGRRRRRSPTPGSTAPSCSSPARPSRAWCRPSRAGSSGAGASSRERDTPGAAPAARPDRGQGPDHALPLARRAGRGRPRTPPARDSRSEAEAAGLAIALGPQGARDPAAGADRQGPAPCASWCARGPVRSRAVRRRRRDRPRRLRRARPRCVDEGELDARRPRGRPLGRGPAGDRRAAPTWSWTAIDGLRSSVLAALGPTHEVPRLPARRPCCCYGGGGHRAGGRVRRGRHAAGHEHARLRGARSGGAWRRSPGCGWGAAPTTTDGHRAPARRRAQHELAARARARERSCSTGSGRWRVLARARAARSASSSRRCPAVATGLLPARGAAVAQAVDARWQAIEGRDGVEFWFDRSSPLGPPKLLRCPGLRQIEPVAERRALPR